MARRGLFRGGYRSPGSNLSSYIKSFVQKQIGYADYLRDYEFSEGQISDEDYLAHYRKRAGQFGGKRGLQYQKKYNSVYYRIRDAKITNLYERGLISEQDVYDFKRKQLKRFDRDSVEYTELQTDVARWKERADNKRRALTRARMLRDISAGTATDEDKLVMLEKLWQEAAAEGDELGTLRIETEYNNTMNRINRAGGRGGYGRGYGSAKAVYKQFKKERDFFDKEVELANSAGDRKKLRELFGEGATYMGSDGKEHPTPISMLDQIRPHVDNLSDTQYGVIDKWVTRMDGEKSFANQVISDPAWMPERKEDEQGNFFYGWTRGETETGEKGPVLVFGDEKVLGLEPRTGADVVLPVSTYMETIEVPEEEGFLKDLSKSAFSGLGGRINRFLGGKEGEEEEPEKIRMRQIKGGVPGYYPSPEGGTPRYLGIEKRPGTEEKPGTWSYGGLTFGTDVPWQTTPKGSLTEEESAAAELGIGTDAFYNDAIISPKLRAEIIRAYRAKMTGDYRPEEDVNWESLKAMVRDRFNRVVQGAGAAGGIYGPGYIAPGDTGLQRRVTEGYPEEIQKLHREKLGRLSIRQGVKERMGRKGQRRVKTLKTLEKRAKTPKQKKDIKAIRKFEESTERVSPGMMGTMGPPLARDAQGRVIAPRAPEGRGPVSGILGAVGGAAKGFYTEQKRVATERRAVAVKARKRKIELQLQRRQRKQRALKQRQKRKRIKMKKRSPAARKVYRRVKRYGEKLWAKSPRAKWSRKYQVKPRKGKWDIRRLFG